MKWLILAAALFTGGILHAQALPLAGAGALPVSGTPSGCGPGTLGDQCGNTAPYPSPIGSETAITSCTPTIVAGGNYKLTADLSCGLNATAMNIVGPGTRVNLNGHAIAGFVNMNTNTNGIHLFSSAAGASVTCQTDSSSQACIYGNVTGSSFTALFEVDHITVTNTQVSSTSSARNLFFDFSSINSGALTGVVNIAIHHITSLSATGLTSSRIVNLQVQATGTLGVPSNKAYVEWYNNFTTCQSNAAACQGIVSYGLWNTLIHNNSIINQLANPSSSETARGMICDQTAGCEVYFNTFSAQDGRAVRMRGTFPTNDVNSIHDNTINDIVAGTNGNHVAAIHFGDGDCPDPCNTAENITLNNNTINFTSGQILMQRNVSGTIISNNVIHGTGTIPFVSERVQQSNTGTVNTNGTTTVTKASGANFVSAMAGQVMVINGIQYRVATFNSATSLTMATPVVTGSGLSYSYGGIANTSMTATNNSASPGTLSSSCDTGAFGGFFNSGTSSGGSCGFPVIPAGAGLIDNLQTAAFTKCNAANGCAAGTPSCVGDASLTLGNPTPSLTGASAKFINTTGAGSPTGCNTLYYRHIGTTVGGVVTVAGIPQTTVTNAVLDLWVRPTPNTGGIVGYEFDPDFFVLNAWTYKISIACYATNGGKWDVYDQSIQNWRATTASCNMNTAGINAWHHIQLWVTIDQTAHQYTFQELIFDGSIVFSPSNPPVCLAGGSCKTFGGWAHDSGNTPNIEMQIDSTSLAGDSIGYYDLYRYWVW